MTNIAEIGNLIGEIQYLSPSFVIVSLGDFIYSTPLHS